MHTLLTLENVSAVYGDKTVLQGINLEVKSDDFIAVIGPNGAGKTTLLKLILKTHPPSKGAVRYNHTNGRMKIGYLPQIQDIDRMFPIRVKDVVLTGLLSTKSFFPFFNEKQIEMCNSAMRKLGVFQIKNKSIGDLSGGQAQRVFLARAVVSSPDLLVLDEPNTYVDKDARETFFELIKTIGREMAVIMVSHDIGSILPIVKTVVCVNETLHFHGPVTEVNQKTISDTYDCPIELIGHGDFPHRVL